MLRRLLAVATALTLLVSAAAFVAGPADAAKKPSFRLSVYDPPYCSTCEAPITRAQGDPLVVHGFIAPGEKRPYAVEQRAGGTWHVINKRTTHNGSTAFHVTHASTGHYAIRAVASRYHGHRRVVSNTVSWTVLLKTTESASYSANPAPANSSTVVSGRFAPAGARLVEVLTTDSRYGHPFGWSATSNPDGTFAIEVSTRGPGTYMFRVVVPATSTEAESSVWLPALHIG